MYSFDQSLIGTGLTETPPVAGEAKDPMQKQRLLVIGLGSIGEHHLRCALETERAEVIACEINRELRCAVAERYGVREVFEDFDAALAATPRRP